MIVRTPPSLSIIGESTTEESRFKNTEIYTSAWNKTLTQMHCTFISTDTRINPTLWNVQNKKLILIVLMIIIEAYCVHVGHIKLIVGKGKGGLPEMN